ncbi:hypothetical protein BDN72DRAFT_961198 [Pluteus cervinus]|uniref:Uncharacterized protein n=1 Tax=Pluteus cervinus TaxID=181527 RepID=A0ACD3AP06_9AGAR|nr:hypothetical protein BDN72DRAFT_961198 [Pluteus cervinus]
MSYVMARHEYAKSSSTSQANITMNVIARGEDRQFSGINDLPPELLTRIFSNLTHQISSREWMSVTHVSRYWRVTALYSSALWSNILVDTPYVKEWLKRSKSYPLSIQLDRSSHRSLPVLQAALCELSRIRQLELTLTPSLWAAVSPHLKVAAPSLESLLLAKKLLHNGNDDGSEVSTPQNLVLPDNIFAGVAPHLNSATFINCVADLKSPIFHGLTSLTIDNPPEAIEPAPPEVLEALRSMPNLETLTLLLDWQWCHGLTFDSKPMVTLPRLSKFTFKADYDAHMYILSRLKFTPTTTLILISIAFNLHTLESAVHNIIKAYYNARGDTKTPVHRLEFSVDDGNPDDLLIQIHRKTDICDFVLDINLKHMKWGESPDGYAMQLFRLPLAPRDSTLVTTIPLSYFAWRRAPDYLVNLTNLSLKSGASESFLDYLNQLYSVPLPESDQDSDNEYPSDRDQDEESGGETSDDDSPKQLDDEEGDGDQAENEEEGSRKFEHDGAGDNDDHLNSLPPRLRLIEIDGPDPKEHSVEGLIRAMKDRKSKFYHLKLHLWGGHRPGLKERFHSLVWHPDVRFSR